MDKNEEFAEMSKDRLSKVIEAKVRTTFIGNLSIFEQEFDEWLRQDNNFKKIWNIVRKKILDAGNNNIRALQKELKQYTIYWTGERFDFIKIGGKCDN